MAERAGVRVPHVDQVIKAGGGTALLVIDQIDGGSLGQLPAQQISDDLLGRLWAEVHTLHRAGIAHRSLRDANVMAGAVLPLASGPAAAEVPNRHRLGSDVVHHPVAAAAQPPPVR